MREEDELLALLTIMLLLLLLAARVLAASRAPSDLRLLRAERGDRESVRMSPSSGPDMGESGTESSEEQMEVPGEFCPLEV